MNKPRIGRPPLAQGESKESRLIIRLKRSEEDEIEAAAQQAGRSKSEWCRDVLLNSAKGGGHQRRGKRTNKMVEARSEAHQQHEAEPQQPFNSETNEDFLD
jgi:hypothetical protein